MNLPVEPDLGFILFVSMTPLLVGFILAFKNANNTKRFFTILISGIVISIIMMVITTEERKAYNAEMMQIIDTVDCSLLPNIADERTSFKNEVVDEIVLRCLVHQDNPVLAEFLREARG